MRNFHAFDEHYLNIAYEINTYLTVSRLLCRNLHSIRKHFVVMPQEEVVDYYSHVAVLEPVASSLSIIIRNRRKEGLLWSFHEFCALFDDLVEGLCVLHGNGLTHNDIRPSNVYYSSQKDCFLLGSFSNVMRRAAGKA
jgi:serine/threonine protein kinase